MADRDVSRATPEPAASFALEDRVCPLCNSSAWSREFVAARYDEVRLDGMSFSSRKDPQGMHYRFVECTACDILYASPVQTPDALVAAYRDAEYESASEAQHAAETYARVLDGVLQELPDLRGAVDIGAGDGAFVEKLVQAGFEDVVGFEPSAAPREAADSSIAALIRPEQFVAGVLRERAFSLVSCLQTIEHVPDPLGLCTDAARALVSGGALMIVCHDRRALTARILKQRSPIFDIEHLQLFSPPSARRLLERSGFERVEVRRLANRYPFRYWLRLAPMPGRLHTVVLRLLVATRLADRELGLRAGNLVVVGYAR